MFHTKTEEHGRAFTTPVQRPGSMDAFSSRRFTATIRPRARHGRPVMKTEYRDPPLPPHWTETVKSCFLHVFSLAKHSLVYSHGWAADSTSRRVRDKARIDRSDAQSELLREMMRIKDSRMERVEACHRPRYSPQERMAILEIKTAHNWSLEQTAKGFLVTAATVASWMKRIDEDGPDALVQLPEPVNKFPDFVAHLVRKLKTLSPTLGKKKIAETLARAGLHLSATTVGRMLKGAAGKPADSAPDDPAPAAGGEAQPEAKKITAKHPNHVWHVDLTVVPTGAGLCCTWLPLALPQCWPFCYWAAVVVDHFSRRAMGATALKKQPDSSAVRAFLGRAIAKAKQAPKHIVCDRGAQFDCAGFRDWCSRKGIKRPRYGAVGKHGSIAVTERFILTLKTLLRCLLLVPYKREAFQRELDLALAWYNRHRPHTWLGGKTPDEVYYGQFPANRRPRHEPRERWPRGSPCARPWALVRGSPGARLQMHVSFVNGHKHLPLISLCRAA